MAMRVTLSGCTPPSVFTGVVISQIQARVHFIKLNSHMCIINLWFAASWSMDEIMLGCGQTASVTFGAVRPTAVVRLRGHARQLA